MELLFVSSTKTNRIQKSIARNSFLVVIAVVGCTIAPVTSFLVPPLSSSSPCFGTWMNYVRGGSNIIRSGCRSSCKSHFGSHRSIVTSITITTTTAVAKKPLRKFSFSDRSHCIQRMMSNSVVATATENEIGINGSNNPFECNDDDGSSSCLEYDHYNGITIHLEKWRQNCNDASFEDALRTALGIWKQEGRRGIWIHVPKSQADKIPIAMQCGFNFHMVTASTTSTTNNKANSNELVLSLWLPSLDISTITKQVNGSSDVAVTSTILSESRLPNGPTHQIGVGIFLVHPWRPNYMLVVQEQSGPAAAYQIWKMPTGLSDAGEDIHTAALRELKEETGLDGIFDGILQFRQSHPNPTRFTLPNATSSLEQKTNEKLTNLQPNSNSNAHTLKQNGNDDNKTRNTVPVVSRKVSDLFFVCKVSLQQHHLDVLSAANGDDDDINNGDNTIWKIDPVEIKAIQWMSMEEYCNQSIWKRSPAYGAMNHFIQNYQNQSKFLQNTIPLVIQPPPPQQGEEVSSDSPETSTTTTKNLPSTTFYQSSKL